MKLQKLPPEIEGLLQELNAPPRLIAHLTLVHDVALKLCNKLSQEWPELVYDKEAVIFGAATHDIGKAVHKAELSGPGKQHEIIGPSLLSAKEFKPDYARFARTHGLAPDNQELTIEDLLVILADKIWKGQRNEVLEETVSKLIAEKCQEQTWTSYMKLDDILNEIAQEADQRLAWQASFPL